MKLFNLFKNRQGMYVLVALILIFALVPVLSGCGGGSSSGTGSTSGSSSGNVTSYSGSGAPGDAWDFAINSASNTFTASDGNSSGNYYGTYSGTYGSPDSNGFITFSVTSTNNSTVNFNSFYGISIAGALFIMPETAYDSSVPYSNPLIYFSSDGSCLSSFNSNGYDYIIIPTKNWDIGQDAAYGHIDSSFTNSEYPLTVLNPPNSSYVANDFTVSGVGSCSGGIYGNVTVSGNGSSTTGDLVLNSSGMLVMDFGNGITGIGGIVGAPDASVPVGANFSTSGVGGSYSGFAFGRCNTSTSSDSCPFTVGTTGYATIPITATVPSGGGTVTVHCYSPTNPTQEINFHGETNCADILSFTPSITNSMGTGTMEYFPGASSYQVNEDYSAILSDMNGKWVFMGLSYTPVYTGLGSFSGYNNFSFVLVQQ